MAERRNLLETLDKKKIPYHVAIIMDGNGRWAQKRGLPRIEGHKQGAKSVDSVTTTARKIGIKYLTLYAFSKDNWKRPKDEILALFDLLRHYLSKKKDKMKKNQIKFNVVGDIEDLPQDIVGKINEVKAYTSDCNGMVLTLALSYSGKSEIVKACKKILKMYKDGKITEEEIDNNLFSDMIGLPDVDLLIRTSGEMRVSDFLLWNIAYAEVYITKKLWPDFRGKDLIKAMKEFQKRERRFGLTQEQIMTMKQDMKENTEKTIDCP